MIKRDFSLYHEWLKSVAKERHEQKKKYKSCKPLSPNYEIVGVIGEFIYSLIMGEKFDHKLLRDGDDGYDFKNNVNVKASEQYKAKHLIEYIDKDPIPEIYVFSIVELQKQTGHLKGWITGKEFLEKAERIDFGYGDRYAIPLSDLYPIQTFKPYIERIKLIHKATSKELELINNI